jgi:hypothetical protein
MPNEAAHFKAAVSPRPLDPFIKEDHERFLER